MSGMLVIVESALYCPLVCWRECPTQVFLWFQLKSEHLTVTKISERGKKQKKNWTMVWSELTSDQLTFYKHQPQTAANQV